MASQTESPDFEQTRSPKVSRKPHHRSAAATAYNSSTLPMSPKPSTKSSKNGSSLRPIRVRIVMVGSERAGKSCLIKRYCEKRFVAKYLPTIGIDYGATKIYVDKREVSVHIFDTSGNPVFQDIRNEFYLDAHGILLVYDVSRRETFYSLSKWLHEIRSELLHRGSGEDITGDCASKTVVVCANKVDLNDGNADSVVDDVEAKLWAELHGFPYCETSACTGQGVADMFQTFFSLIVRQHLENNPTGTMPRTPASARRVQLTQSSSSLPPMTSSVARDSLAPTPEQSAVMKLLKSGNANQLFPVGAGPDEINRIYRKLAVLLHPDKTSLPGADEAFKLLGVARRNLLVQASC